MKVVIFIAGFSMYLGQIVPLYPIIILIFIYGWLLSKSLATMKKSKQ